MDRVLVLDLFNRACMSEPTKQDQINTAIAELEKDGCMIVAVYPIFIQYRDLTQVLIHYRTQTDSSNKTIGEK